MNQQSALPMLQHTEWQYIAFYVFKLTVSEKKCKDKNQDNSNRPGLSMALAVIVS